MNAMKKTKETKKYVNLHTEEVSSLPERFWMEGYLIGYSPIEGTADTQLIRSRIDLEWSLETGESVFHELTLPDWDEDGDAICEKLLTIFSMVPFQVDFLEELLVQRCGLLVTAEWVTDEESERLVYELHDLCSLEDLQRHRIHDTEKPKPEVN